MKTLHLVYPVPSIRKPFRILNRICNYFFSINLFRFYPSILKWGSPIQAPLSITYNIISCFKKKYKIRLYGIGETGNIELKKDDIFIGHYWPDSSTKSKVKNYWSTYDPKQITNKVVLKYPNDKRVFLIAPFNHDKGQIDWAIPLFEKTKNFIAICGDYWTNNVYDMFPVFKNCKFNQLNMALDVSQYPFLKKKFNEKGKRKFLYIGRVSEEKNIGMLENIADSITKFEGGYIAQGAIIGWKQIAPSASLTPQFIKTLTDEYDFFINTSTFDAQATTILEAMSWGFGIACTPQSGYQHDSIFELSIDDLNDNIKTIERMQEMDEKELILMQKKNLELVINKYSWTNFQEHLVSIVNN